MTNDSTQRKLAEDEIERLKEFSETIIQHMTEGVVVEDTSGHFTFVNPAMCAMLGHSRETLLGRHWTEVTPPEWQTQVRDANVKRIAGERHQYELALSHRDGSQVPVLISGCPLYDPATGQFVGTLAVFTNISEHKRAEERLRQAKEAAEAASRAKSVFLANMSHELRTPLNAILGFSELMRRDPAIGEHYRENLAIIHRSGEHLLRLINDILDMAKIEAGRSTLQQQDFDLQTLLRELSEMFRLRADSKGIALVFDLPADLPRFLYGDDRKLRQILINLLSNAVKFTDEGQVALRLSHVSVGSTNLLCVAVQDTGPGIPAAELAVIFEPFRQLNQPEKIREGTGLGLSISREFVRIMGGELTVISDGIAGRGSLFKFDIPVQPAREPKELGSRLERVHVVGLEPGQPAFRLLVVEDSESNRRLLVELLTHFGFSVRSAANGLDGVRAWQEWRPHLIWMDMRMPVMDGHEATRQIKATSQGQATAIIALTASVFDDDRELILSEGCDDFVRKPFREQEIVDRLVKFLGVRFVFEPEPEGAADLLAGKRFTPEGPLAGRPSLARLPADWIDSLERAATEANSEDVLSLAERVREERPDVVESLSGLVKAFDYDAILSAIHNQRELGIKDE